MAERQSIRKSSKVQDLNGASNPNWRGGKLMPCCLCGKEVWRKPSQWKARKAVVCQQCLPAWIRQAQAGERSCRWSGGDERRKCPTCGKEYIAKRRDINRNKANFCSKPCWAATRKSERTPGKCEFCHKAFEMKPWQVGKKRFCSGRCKKRSQIKIRTPMEIARKKINGSMAGHVWKALKQKKAGRRWEKLVGYTVLNLMRHLQSLFKPGMTWKNYGKKGWEIDHIRPRCSFSFESTDDPEFKACWALSNLQPLWGEENNRKNAKMPTGILA